VWYIQQSFELDEAQIPMKKTSEPLLEYAGVRAVEKRAAEAARKAGT
jgi:hypothetical protein